MDALSGAITWGIGYDACVESAATTGPAEESSEDTPCPALQSLQPLQINGRDPT